MKTGVLVGLALPLAGGELKSRGPIPTSGQLSESEEKHSRLRVTELICGSLNGMRIRQSSLQPYTPGRNTGLQELGAGVWGLWSSLGARAAVDCRDRLRGCEGGDHSGKCRWRKARQPWKRGDTAELQVVGGAITIASLSPHASISG